MSGSSCTGTGCFPLRKNERERTFLPSCTHTVHGRVLKRQETPSSPTRGKGSVRRVCSKGRKKKNGEKKVITFVSRGLHARCLSRTDFRRFHTHLTTGCISLFLSLAHFLSLFSALSALLSFSLVATVKAVPVKGDCGTSRVPTPRVSFPVPILIPK